MDKHQLLAMPDSDYMNSQQLAFFKELLTTSLAEATAAADEAKGVLADAEALPDISDWATSEQERHSALRALERNNGLRRKILKALDRIESGEYGWCEETGEPIGLARLLSRPAATLCIEAKQRQEALERHRYKMRGAA